MELTRFEKARVVGARSLQLGMGAPAILDSEDNLVDPVGAAQREFAQGVIPVTVTRRHRPF